METKLIITEEVNNGQIVLKVSGRLDANNAGYLDDTLSNLIQKGKYMVGLDMQDVAFLSSAGIRILVKQSKSFKIFSGELSITNFSENVQSVLDMVGMIDLFKPKVVHDAPVVQTKTEKELERADFVFLQTIRDQKASAKLQMKGSPNKMETSSYDSSDVELITLDKPWFGLGLGAFGSGFEDCRNRFGEFVALGDSLITLPSDMTVTPDYIVRSGQLVPEIQSLYSMGFAGSFKQEIHFSPKREASISLSDLVETIGEIGGHRHFAMLFIAESNGLVGASIKTSPTSGKNPFNYPEVKDTVKFTTEPWYIKETIVSLGIFSYDPGERMKNFLRPLGNGSTINGHVHSVVFTYLPLRKENPDYPEAIGALLENAAMLDVLHLVNDNREINGIGESSFKTGVCWSIELDPDSII